MDEELDLIVIGGGPGGYVAGIRAGQLGLKVAVVEQDAKLGGTCLHRGCIPTKALLHTAALLEDIRHAERFGITVGAPTVDLERTRVYRQNVIAKNAKGIEYLFKKNQVRHVRGRGRLDGAAVVVEGEGEALQLRARCVLLATGSVPKALPAAPVDGERVLDSDQILELGRVPASLVVLGGGAVGVEFTSIFAAFGAEVTIVEMLPRLLPVEDEEISRELERALRKRGLRVLTGARFEKLERGPAGVRVWVADGETTSSLDAELLLVAVGRTPATAALGLEAAGVELEGGCVRVDPFMRTTVPNVYAIGDLVRAPLLAHKASAEGVLAVEHLAGLPVEPIHYDRVPSCTYCDPEVASVGLTEAEARTRGYAVECGRFPFSASGKAAILGRTDGFVKVVRETRYDELLGVHIIGPHATDLIAEAALALRLESTNEELFCAIHAHPTLSEAIAEAALVAAGRGVHV